jgi:RNA polymerase sigma-70 factor (ECF subfamily)
MSGQTQSGDHPNNSESKLIEALRNGDEAAFAALVEQYYTSMVRIAMLYVQDQAIAEDVVQETWLFTILTNRAKTRAQREGRYVPLATAWDGETEGNEPAVAPDWFGQVDQAGSHNHWSHKPDSWEAVPEDRLLSQETLHVIHDAIDMLPPGQREVIRMRDVEGWSSNEVCNILDISETNQRVLLHRARSKVRRALEQYLAS